MRTHRQSVLARFIALFRKDGTLQPGRLLHQDCRFLRLRYQSDWTLFNAAIVGSSILVFCSNIFPALTFANDLYVHTHAHWGPIEVIFSTGLCGMLFSAFSVQPLTIVGVTGHFSILAHSTYKLVESFGDHVEFLPFMAWTMMHTSWMLILLSVFNAHEWTMTFVTNFTCDIFGLLTSIIFLENAVQELIRTQREHSFASFLWALVSCVGTFLLALLLTFASKWTQLPGRCIRLNLRRYAVPISIVTFAALDRLPGVVDLDQTPLFTSSKALRPSLPNRSGFFVRLKNIPTIHIVTSVGPALIITSLLFFDHSITSIMCTRKRFNLRKPFGLTQPMALLALTTALCGLLGLPPANGTYPQAPLHSESLLYESGKPSKPASTIETNLDHPKERETVLEQRYSNLLSAGAVLAFVAPPLQKLVSFTPTAVLGGTFFVYAYQTFTANSIPRRFGNMLVPSRHRPPLPLGLRSWRGVHAYTLTQIAITLAIFGFTKSRAGFGFPLIIIFLIPLRLKVLSRLWSREVLCHVDRWSCKEGCPEDNLLKQQAPAADEEDDGKVVEIIPFTHHRLGRFPFEAKERFKRMSHDTVSRIRGSRRHSFHSSSIFSGLDERAMDRILCRDDGHTVPMYASGPGLAKSEEWLEDAIESASNARTSQAFRSSRRSKNLSVPSFLSITNARNPTGDQREARDVVGGDESRLRASASAPTQVQKTTTLSLWPKA